MKCAVNACIRPAKTKGLCGKHYQRFRKGKDPHIATAKDCGCINFSDSGCWEWSRPNLSYQGYARIQYNGRQIGAHRVAFEEVIGPIPHGMQVCHRCDNRLCLNPDHLFLGTMRDNMDDKVAKFRQSHGERSSKKLTAEDVEYIRNSTASNPDLAARFGVNRDCISRVRTGRSWKHHSAPTKKMNSGVRSKLMPQVQNLLAQVSK